MKIKRYTATSMRLALSQVRAEQGAEAVILSSRRIDDGIEVIAAVDYDESLIAQPSLPRTPSDAFAPAPAMVPTLMMAPTPSRATANARRSAPPVSPSSDSGYVDMRRELQNLRHLLESELAALSWNDKRLRNPLQARVLEELSALDIAPDVARALAALTPKRTTLEDPAHIPLALLAKHLPVVNDASCANGGVVAVVGPTGVGKTTTIAKLAARWTLQHRSADLALVSTDAYRIGAREQLQTYARILGAPLYAADNGRELAQVLERLRSKKLVLIDTAGVGPRDARLGEQLATLQRGAPCAHVMLALPAQGEGHALQEITAAFAPLSLKACILTKVDEAASLGAAISTALRHRLPIAYLCNGQRVPEDLHSAYQRRVWLARAAKKFKERRGPGRDEAYLAQHFGPREQVHA
jgi:flagellar biosynthesis protein FlhF